LSLDRSETQIKAGGSRLPLKLPGEAGGCNNWHADAVQVN